MGSTTTDRRIGLNSGAAFKVPCKAASTANLVLSGEQTVDGVACVTGDRVLVKDQTDQTTNGLYNAATGNWTRTIDAANNSQVTQGQLVLVSQGSANINTTFELTAVNPVTLGTSLLTYIVQGPPASRLILKALGIEKGSSKAKEQKAGTLTKAQIAAIVEEKMPDLNASSPEAAAKIIEGTARSMGIEVVD